MNLSQYPVFPWVLSDYESKEIDLTRNESFRDLSLPMGAIGKRRKFEFMVCDLLNHNSFAYHPPKKTYHHHIFYRTYFRHRFDSALFHSMHTQRRYEEMPSPKYLYSTHFSTPAYAVHYLVRVFPQRFLRLQGGKFDKADRTFTSVANAWKAATEAPADVREVNTFLSFSLFSLIFFMSKHNGELLY